MPSATSYLVAKHYGAGMMHGFGVYDTKEEAESQAKARSRSKGHFKAKAHVRVWKMIKEIEVKDAVRK